MTLRCFGLERFGIDSGNAPEAGSETKLGLLTELCSCRTKQFLVHCVLMSFKLETQMPRESNAEFAQR